MAALRASRWTYPLVSAAHLTGIALLFGAILPLDLRLLGARRSVDLAALSRILVPVAAFGLALAAITGAALFAVAAREYAANPAFQIKIAIVALAALNALSFRLRAPPGDAIPAVAAVASALLWLGAIAAGRMIAYV